jgi:hypothetical protein
MKNNETPIAPQNFNEVERYISHLPIDRVKKIREQAEMELYQLPFSNQLRTKEQTIEMLAGYILELTQPPKP